MGDELFKVISYPDIGRMNFYTRIEYGAYGYVFKNGILMDQFNLASPLCGRKNMGLPRMLVLLFVEDV